MTKIGDKAHVLVTKRHAETADLSSKGSAQLQNETYPRPEHPNGHG